jgi:hypothetical protein
MVSSHSTHKLSLHTPIFSIILAGPVLYPLIQRTLKDCTMLRIVMSSTISPSRPSSHIEDKRFLSKSVGQERPFFAMTCVTTNGVCHLFASKRHGYDGRTGNCTCQAALLTDIHWAPGGGLAPTAVAQKISSSKLCVRNEVQLSICVVVKGCYHFICKFVRQPLCIRQLRG